MWGCLMCDVEDSHGNNSTDEEYDVKPSVVEVEVDVSQNLRDDNTEIGRQVHPHQQHTGHKIHAHDLGQEEHQQVTRLSTGDCVKPFYEVYEKSAY